VAVSFARIGGVSQQGRSTSSATAVRPVPAVARPVRPPAGPSGAVRTLARALALLSPVTAVAAALGIRALLPDVPDLVPVFFGDVLLAGCYPVVGAVVLGRQRRWRWRGTPG
jgi:hypothetical protein